MDFLNSLVGDSPLFNGKTYSCASTKKPVSNKCSSRSRKVKQVLKPKNKKQPKALQQHVPLHQPEVFPQPKPQHVVVSLPKPQETVFPKKMQQPPFLQQPQLLPDNSTDADDWISKVQLTV